MRLIPLCVFSLAAAALVQLPSSAAPPLSSCRRKSAPAAVALHPVTFHASSANLRLTSHAIRAASKPWEASSAWATMTGAISVRGHSIDPKMYVAGICNDPGMRPISGLGERACGGGPAVAVLHNGKATMVFMFVPSPNLSVAEKIARIEISK